MGGKAYIPLHPRRTMLDNHHIISHDILIIPLFFFKSPCRTQSKAKSPEIYHYGSDKHVLPPALLSPSMFLWFDPKTENGTEKRKRKRDRWRVLKERTWYIRILNYYGNTRKSRTSWSKHVHFLSFSSLARLFSGVPFISQSNRRTGADQLRK